MVNDVIEVALNIAPFSATAPGFVILGETVHALALIGGVLALAGAAANRTGTRIDRLPDERPRRSSRGDRPSDTCAASAAVSWSGRAPPPDSPPRCT